MSSKIWYTLAEASEATGLTKKALRRRIERGTLETILYGGSRLINITEIEKIVASRAPEELTTASSAKLLEEAKSLLEGNREDKNLELIRELAQSQAELREMRRVVASYNQRARFEDRITNTVQQAIANNPYTPRLSPPKAIDASDSGEHEMLLLVSDAHYPEVVDPEAAMGIVYGPEIVRRRMEHITERVKRLYDIHASNYPINKLTIGVLGDMLSGNIHEELEVTNAMPMSEALTDMSYMLYDMGAHLSRDLPVEMVIMPGNHPRMTKKPRNKHKWDNFEYIMGQMVKALANDQFEVIVPKDILYTHQIFDFNIGFTHGDGSKAASFAGIPFYGLKQRSNATQAMRSVLDLDRLYMLCMGHFHQFLYWTEGDCHIFINGAIKGGDEYSIVTRSSATEPVQGLHMFHKERGLIVTERIPLGDIV